MTDILGSLLPEGYAAPDVQGVLGGELLKSLCENPGSSPSEGCGTGSTPSAQCRPSGNGPVTIQ